MVKTLTRIGNSFGVIIDRSILELLKIDPAGEVQLTITPDGQGLELRPVKTNDHRARVRESAKRMSEIHDKVLKRLAE